MGDLGSELLQKANRQLLSENEALKKAQRQRTADVAVMFAEGLGVLLEEAERGNQPARAVVELLARELEAARAMKAGLELPAGAHGGPLKA